MSNSIPYIDRYFNGELIPAEKKTFESRCLSDPAFARMVAFYISLHDHLKEQWAEQTKQEFAELEEVDSVVDPADFGMNSDLNVNIAFQKRGEKVPSINKNPDDGIPESRLINEGLSFAAPLQIEALKEEKEKGKKIRIWIRLAVAAAISGIIAFSIIWYEQRNKNNSIVAVNNKNPFSINKTHTSDTATATNIVIDTIAKQTIKKNDRSLKRLGKQEQQQLFAKIFKPDTTPKETQGLLEEAFDHYKNGNYKTASNEYKDAIAVVESLETRMPEDRKSAEEKIRLLFYAHYYHALSNMADGKSDIAISELKAIKQSPDKFWQSKLQWYLALAYLKTGQVEKAGILLKQVADNKQAGEYRQKAINLANELTDKPAN